MSDIEDMLRRTFDHHGQHAPASDHLLADVRSRVQKGHSGQRWLVPVVASLLTAAVVLVVTTDGFNLWDGAGVTNAPPTTSIRPTPDSSQSVRAMKCGDAPGVNRLRFKPNETQDISVEQGRRLLLEGVDGFCQRTVTFNGKKSSPILRSNPPYNGADWLQATSPGVVTISVFQPMCVASTDPECFGGLSMLGSIRVTVVPKTPLEPITRVCAPLDVRISAASEPGTAAQLLWGTVRLRGNTACRLSDRAAVEVIDRRGVTVQMPHNPLTRLVSAPLRADRPVVVIWDWVEPFCGRQFPYRVRFTLLGHVDTVRRVTPPGCPTDYGEPPTDPRGLHFHEVRVLH
jgi:hypothetical protein